MVIEWCLISGIKSGGGKKLAVQFDLDPVLFGTRSLRIGGTTQLRAEGASTEFINFSGRMVI